MTFTQKIQTVLIPKAIGTYLNATSYINKKHSGNKALQIFGQPRKGVIRPYEYEYLNTYTKHTLYHNSIPIQTYSKGNGAIKILLLHGWESNAARWRNLAELLVQTNNYTVILADAPAHGASGSLQFDSILYAHFIQQVVQHYKPNIAIGHSIGAGSIVYYLSQLQAYTFTKLILMGSPNTFTEIMQAYINIIGLKRNAIAALEVAILRKYNMPSTQYNISEYIKNVTIPTYIIHDNTDVISPVANAYAIASNCPNATLKVTTGYGHGLKHQVINELILEYINN